MVVCNLESIELPVIKAGEGHFALLFQLVQNRGELLVIPPAGNFVERNIEDALLLLVELDLYHLYLGVAILHQHLEPLVAAYDVAGGPVPYDGLNVAEGLDAPGQLFVLLVARCEVFPRVVVRRMEVTHRQSDNFHLPFLPDPFRVAPAHKKEEPPCARRLLSNRRKNYGFRGFLFAVGILHFVV